MISLLGRSFNCKILPEIDPLNQGRYKVNIPQLQPLSNETVSIWVKNHVHKYRDTGSKRYGQYFPIQPGTQVLVKFYYPNDINSGYIDRILDDDFSETGYDAEKRTTLPFNQPKEDRDEVYQIIRTPKHKCLFLIAEDVSESTSIPKESIHLYYKKYDSTIIIDNTGINFTTVNNEYHRVGNDYSILIQDNYFNTTVNNHNHRVGGEYRLAVNYDMNMRSLNGNIYIQADDNSINLLSHHGSVNTIAKDYVSISAYQGTVAIGGTKVMLCSNGDVAINAHDGNVTMIGQNVIIGAHQYLGIASGSNMILSTSSKMMFDFPEGQFDVSNNGMGASYVRMFDNSATINPVSIQQADVEFLSGYDYNDYTSEPPGADPDDATNCTTVYSVILNSIPYTGIITDTEGNYISKYQYEEASKQQKQFKRANTLFEIQALIAQEALPPEPNRIQFEGNS